MSPEVKRAYHSWNSQRIRCTYPKHTKYGYYGGKGVQIRYKLREFVTWWLSELEKNPLERPTCGRIDHDGHYEFGNVYLEEYSSNVKDRNERNRAKQSIVVIHESGYRSYFDSLRAAACILELSIEDIKESLTCSKKLGKLVFEKIKR